jgi:predicted NBD/HSP70 family sugar kinase
VEEVCSEDFMLRSSKPTVMDIRRVNRSTVLRSIYLDRAVSRQELSQRTGLSPATVTNVVTELLQDGVVVEAGVEESQGGRPRSILTINPHYGYFLGVEIGETLTRIELFDLTLRKLGASACALALDESGPEHLVESLSQRVKVLLDEAGVTAEQVIGVGTGVGGVVELTEPVSVYLPNWGWRNVLLGGLLHKRLGMPIFLDNAAKAMALAESLFGAAQGIQHAVVLLVGTGIGAGIIAHGSLYRGAINSAGEWGHTCLELNGRLCRCGGHGCLEAYAGVPGILERLREVEPLSPLLQGNDQHRSLAALVDAFKQGEPVATQLLNDTAHYLGAGIANLINLFNPQLILLGGWAGLELGAVILPELHHFVERYAALKPLLSLAKLELCQLGHDAVPMGAATLVLEHFLTTTSRPNPASELKAFAS